MLGFTDPGLNLYMLDIMFLFAHMPCFSGRDFIVFNLFSQNSVAKEPHLMGTGAASHSSLHSGRQQVCMSEQSPHFTSQGARKGSCDLPRVTRLIVRLDQTSLLTPSPGLVPLLKSSPTSSSPGSSEMGKEEEKSKCNVPQATPG